MKDEEVRKTDMARNGGHTMLAKRVIGVTVQFVAHAHICTLNCADVRLQ